MGLLEAKAGDFADGKFMMHGPKRVIVLVVWLVGLLLWISAASAAGTEKADSAGPRCVVEVEEVVTRYRPANNGAGPLWCYGSTVIARHGKDVYLSVIETGEGVPLLCNTRWQLWHRSASGWKIEQSEEEFR